MKPSYDIYAIGSCLTDIHYELKQETLESFHCEYGMQVLSDPKTQEKILAQLPPLKDLTVSPAGSAATTAATVGTLGGQAFFAGRIGLDTFGELNLEDFKKCSISIDRDKAISKQSPTGTCICLISEDHERSMSTCLGANQEFDAEHIDTESLERSKYLFVEGYLVKFPHGMEIIHKSLEVAKSAQVQSVFCFCDPSIPKYFRSQLESVLTPGVFDIIICNEEESQLYCQTQDSKKIHSQLLKLCNELVITKGDQGAQYLTKNTVIEVPAIPTEVIDTTGAGDSFAGAFLYARSQKQTPKESLEFACKVSSKVIQGFGPRLKSPKL